MRIFQVETDTHSFAIDQEVLTELGRPENTEAAYHLFIRDKKDPSRSRDYLESSIQLAMRIAEEDFGLKPEAWIEVTED